MDTKTKMKKIADFAWIVLPVLWVLGGLALMMWFQWGPGYGLIDGDMGGEMILSDLLNKEKDFLLSKNWYYATEIHVFFMQIIFRPLLLIWGNDWHMVRVVGMFLIYLINGAGYLFLGKEMGAERKGLFSLGLLIWPVGMWRMFLGLYGGQYLVYDFFFVYILALIMYLSNNKEAKLWKKIIAIIALSFLSFAGGINGVREAMMLFMPICLGIAASFICKLLRSKPTSWKNYFESLGKRIRLLGFIVLGLIFNVIGYGINLTYLMKHYSYQSNTTMMLSEKFSLNAFFSSMSDFFSLWGYLGNVKLLSKEGIASACGIVIALVIVFSIVRLCILRAQMNERQELMFFSFVFGLLALALLFGHMEEMNEPRFWTPFMIFAVVIVQTEADLDHFKLPNLKGLLGIALALVVMIASYGTVRDEIDNPSRGFKNSLSVANFLKDNGYTQGYAEFWLANTITEQTSGVVKARPMMYTDTFEMIPWSNRIDYATTLPEGPVFYVLYKNSYGDYTQCCFYKYGSGEVVRDDEICFIKIFDSANEMLLAYKTAVDLGEAQTQEAKIAGE